MFYNGNQKKLQGDLENVPLIHPIQVPVGAKRQSSYDSHRMRKGRPLPSANQAHWGIEGFSPLSVLAAPEATLTVGFVVLE